MARAGYVTLAVAKEQADALRRFKALASATARRRLNTGEALALAVVLAGEYLDTLSAVEAETLIKSVNVD